MLSSQGHLAPPYRGLTLLRLFLLPLPFLTLGTLLHCYGVLLALADLALGEAPPRLDELIRVGIE